MLVAGGVIAERGVHQQLLDRGGLYYDMWSQQQKDIEIEQAKEENAKLLDSKVNDDENDDDDDNDDKTNGNTTSPVSLIDL